MINELRIALNKYNKYSVANRAAKKEIKEKTFYL